MSCEVPTRSLRYSVGFLSHLPMPRWVYRKGIRDTGPIMVLLGISGLATFIQSVLEPRQPPAFRLHQQILRLHVATMQRRDLCPSVEEVQGWIKQARAISDFRF